MRVERTGGQASSNVRPRRVLYSAPGLSVALVLCVTAFLAAASRMVDTAVGSFHDDGIYVANGKALAEGQGYRSINLPGAPYQTKYPPLFPSMLAIVWRIWPDFPANAIALKSVSAVCMALAALLMSMVLIRGGYATPSLTLAAGLLVWTSPFTAYFGSQTLSEMPFAVLLAASLWWVEREDRCDVAGSRFRAGALVAVPALARVLGISLVAAVVMKLAPTGRRGVVAVVAGAALVAGPWLAWSIERGAASDPVLVYYSDYFGWALPTLSATGRTVVVNTRLLADALVNFGFIPLSAPFGAWTGWLLLLASAWGIAVEVRRGRLLGFVLLSYLALVLVWPWPPARFTVPIGHPLIALALRPLWSVGRKPMQAAVAIAVSVLLVVNAQLLSHHHRLTSEDRFPYVVLPAPGDRVSWADYLELFDWLRANTAEASVLASGMDSMLYLYTGRRAYRPFTGNAAASVYAGLEPDVGTPERFWAAISSGGAKYIVETPMPWFMEQTSFARLLRDLEERHPAALRQLYTATDPRFRVLEVLSVPDVEANRQGRVRHNLSADATAR